ncbi:hypothetical protein BDW22DRAFT_874825 [Trametopsis cervina]|nr:hypothetical protein BDW22DRAFT_874825 [Trametopsis cervina]
MGWRRNNSAVQMCGVFSTTSWQPWIDCVFTGIPVLDLLQANLQNFSFPAVRYRRTPPPINPMCPWKFLAPTEYPTRTVIIIPQSSPKVKLSHWHRHAQNPIPYPFAQEVLEMLVLCSVDALWNILHRLWRSKYALCTKRRERIGRVIQPVGTISMACVCLPHRRMSVNEGSN